MVPFSISYQTPPIIDKPLFILYNHSINNKKSLVPTHPFKKGWEMKKYFFNQGGKMGRKKGEAK